MSTKAHITTISRWSLLIITNCILVLIEYNICLGGCAHACKLVLKPSTSYQLLGNWHRHTYIAMPKKTFCWLHTMPHMCPHRDSGVNFWSKTVWSWNMGKATCQQYPKYVTGRQWENTCSSTAVLSVVSEWVIGHWLWMHVMNCAHGFRLWTHKLCPLVIHFAGYTWQGYQRSIQQYMMLSWRECLLYNGVIRSSHWWHLTRAKSNDMYTF